MKEPLEKRIQDLLDNPKTNLWIKVTLGSAVKRDPLEALNDAELITSILSERLDEITRNA